jgi:hypothetical protein
MRMKFEALAAALAIPAVIVLATTGTTACGQDSCEEAAEITEDCTPPASSSGTTTTVETTKSECSGANEKLAKCIIDNKDAFCAFMKNPTASDPNNAYSKCATGAQ